MTTEILAEPVAVVRPPTSLGQRVYDAIALLSNTDGLAVDAPPDVPSHVAVIHHGRRVELIDASYLQSAGNAIEETIARAVRGEIALLILGSLPERLEPLLARGVHDVIDTDATPARLMLALRNALEVLELRERSENRARWLRRTRYEAATLIETARALSRERDIHKLLALILEKCRFIAGADAGSIYVVEGTDPDVEKRSLRFKLSQNESVSFPTGEFVMPVSMRSIAGYVTISKQIAALDDVYAIASDAPFSFDRSFDARVGYRTRSVLTVPLVSAEDEVIGVVQLINKKRDVRARLRTPTDVDIEVIPFDERSIELVASLAAQAGVALENATLYLEIQRILEGFVRASVQAIEQRDPTTSGHSQRVSVLSCRLAEVVDRVGDGPYRGVHFTSQDLRELEYASLLHDFGKIGVREQVLVKAKKLHDWQLRLIRSRFDFLLKASEAELAARRAELFARNAPLGELQALEVERSTRIAQVESFWELIKDANEPTLMPQGASERIDELARMTYTDPRGLTQSWVQPEEVASLKVARGSLTNDEIEEIRSHVLHTFEFLSRIPWGKSFAHVPLIAGCHHEKINGRGYPRGLKGAEIPVGARIMAIADIFDALTASDRPYKKAVPIDRALGILQMEVNDGGLDGELVKIFTESGVYRAIQSGPTF